MTTYSRATKIILIVAVILAAVPAVIGLLLLRTSVYGGSLLVERNETHVNIILDKCARTMHLPNPALVYRLTKLGLRLTGRTIPPGWYHAGPNDSQLDVILMLVQGKHEPYVKVTIPEGFTTFRIASRLHQRAQIDSADFISWCASDSVKQSYSITSPTMEGFLKPATYLIIRAESAPSIAMIMAREAMDVWLQVCTDSSTSRDSIVTLASIVQREAAKNSELPRIAGVYHNRLKVGMRLEADPTLQYGRDNVITKRELRDAANLYNTYQHSGLPPGPICNPGIDAIKAVLSPERHNFIFFVARGDSSNEHRFASTYAEHLKNVRLYRARQR